MMSEVPYGVLLSGGLDSSLVAAIAARKYRELKNGARILSYAIGLEGQSPDLEAAQRAADFIGVLLRIPPPSYLRQTEHHAFTFNIEDGIDAIPRLVWHLETYDITTIRASTPMFLLARKIKAMGTKMVLSGEGSDEIFGGTLCTIGPD
jgi:asparagine synthase (glutamine-hydrolysing)